MPERAWGEPLPEDPVGAASAALGEMLNALTAPVSAQPAEEVTREQTRQLFTAIDDNDIDTVRSLLEAGLPADSVLTPPLNEDLLTRFRKDFLVYYVTKDSGLTPLMFAAGRGRLDIAILLLEHGAKRNARTSRHGTHALWLAGYAGHVSVEQLLLGVQPGSEADRTMVEIDLSSQTARLMLPDATEKVVPISSGKRRFATPKGEYVVTNKHRQWKSTLYGASMPFYLRLSSRDFGLHAGHLPGYPASHGCIRLHRKDAESFFNHIPVGTRVVIR